MRTGSRERYTASPRSVFQTVSAMTAATRRDCAGKRAAPSFPSNADAGVGRRRRCCEALVGSQRRAAAVSPVQVQPRPKEPPLRLGPRRITAYRMCEQSSLTPKTDLMRFTNEETKAEPLAPFIY